jgi:serine/threonine-protein kinase
MLDFKKVTPSGDLYATAATLYYLITSCYIYDEISEGGDLIRTLLEEPPVPIRHRRPEVPQGLADVLERCLAREPEARFPSASDVRRALRSFC